MEQHGYPDYCSHKSIHDNFVQKVLDMQEKHYSGNTDIYVEIAILMNDWIVDHILIEDKKYAPYLKLDSSLRSQ